METKSVTPNASEKWVEPIGSIRAALWDAHYGKGLSAEYARSADTQLDNLAIELQRLRDENKRLKDAVAETWKTAMEIANTCVQEHSHLVNEYGERENPAGCVYFALEAAAKQKE